MSHPVTQPESDRLVETVAEVFRTGKAFKSRDHSLLFVCGGPTGPTDASLRRDFLEYASRELPAFRVFLSELAAQDLTRSRRPKFFNLATFEELLSEVAECVLIFVESAGSIAELGYFAKSDEISAKLLVVNDLGVQTRESFINNGPVQLINGKSAFQPTVHINPANAASEFGFIKERLSRFNKRYRERFSFKPIGELERQDQLFLILEVINVFRVIDVHGIVHLLTRWCGQPDEEKVRQLISVLMAAGYVRRLSGDSHMFSMCPGIKSFIELDGFAADKFRLELADHYRRHALQLYHLLEEAGS